MKKKTKKRQKEEVYVIVIFFLLFKEILCQVRLVFESNFIKKYILNIEFINNNIFSLKLPVKRILKEI